MIISFGSKQTEKIWSGKVVRSLPEDMQVRARRKLRMLNNAQTLTDLRVPPSNYLEKLAGNLKDYYSIRVNRQWRIIFIWEADNAYDVQIIDYH